MSKKHFEVTRDHIKLVRAILVGWNEDTERVEIDTKRPYGDSDIPRSVAEAIDLDFVEIEGGEMRLTYQQEQRCWKLHRDMATVLQIIFSSGELKSGKYEYDEENDKWKRLKSK